MSELIEVLRERQARGGRRRAALYLGGFTYPAVELGHRHAHAPTGPDNAPVHTLMWGGHHAAVTLVSDPRHAHRYDDADDLGAALTLLAHLGFHGRPRQAPPTPADLDADPPPTHWPADPGARR
ncbi:calponin homology domain-containing protein [Nocardioides ochotonae]|uniref:hypothetical protein n=1 Tax=Nocardioides ochotonae TaxID=2685869 RepID=UPI00174D6FC9|nr:hypothetical protein [Nocardioides ochotonae]